MHEESTPRRLRAPFKPCLHCGDVFSASPRYFQRCQKSRDGLVAICKACSSRREREYLAHNPERNKDKSLRRRLAYPAYGTESYRRYRAGIGDDEYRARVREACRRWGREHPETVRLKSHNARARRKGAPGSHTVADERAQYARQKGRCFWCGSRVGEVYHADHVIPLVLGGSNGPENIVIACPSCNRKKHAKHPMDFAGTLF